jgi:hypothetical protein
LLAARDFVYAHFQLEMECQSMEERRKARKSAKDPTTAEGSAKEKDKEEVKVSGNGVDKSSRNEQDKGDMELPRTGRPATTLYDISRTNYFQRLSQTFKDARSRRALLCASTAMISQQLCGINTIGKRRPAGKFSRIPRIFVFNWTPSSLDFALCMRMRITSANISFLYAAFLSATMLNDVNASNRTAAWVGFCIGLCNFM